MILAAVKDDFNAYMYRNIFKYKKISMNVKAFICARVICNQNYLKCASSPLCVCVYVASHVLSLSLFIQL